MNVIPLAERIRETRAHLAREPDFPKINDTDMDAAVIHLQTLQKSGIRGRYLRDGVIGFMRSRGYEDFSAQNAELLIPLLEGMLQLRAAARVNE